MRRIHSILCVFLSLLLAVGPVPLYAGGNPSRSARSSTATPVFSGNRSTPSPAPRPSFLSSLGGAVKSLGSAVKAAGTVVGGASKAIPTIQNGLVGALTGQLNKGASWNSPPVQVLSKTLHASERGSALATKIQNSPFNAQNLKTAGTALKVAGVGLQVVGAYQKGGVPAAVNAAVRAGASELGGMAGKAIGTNLGAAIGTLIFPGVGTVIGGVIGGIAGHLIGSWVAEKAYDKFVAPVVTKVAQKGMEVAKTVVNAAQKGLTQMAKGAVQLAKGASSFLGKVGSFFKGATSVVKQVLPPKPLQAVNPPIRAALSTLSAVAKGGLSAGARQAVHMAAGAVSSAARGGMLVTVLGGAKAVKGILAGSAAQRVAGAKAVSNAVLWTSKKAVDAARGVTNKAHTAMKNFGNALKGVGAKVSRQTFPKASQKAKKVLSYLDKTKAAGTAKAMVRRASEGVRQGAVSGLSRASASLAKKSKSVGRRAGRAGKAIARGATSAAPKLIAGKQNPARAKSGNSSVGSSKSSKSTGARAVKKGTWSVKPLPGNGRPGRIVRQPQKGKSGGSKRPPQAKPPKESKGPSASVSKDRDWGKTEKAAQSVWNKKQGWQPTKDKKDSTKATREAEYTVFEHEKKRTYSSQETESEDDYAQRPDLAKARHNVRFGTLDTSADAKLGWDITKGEVYAKAGGKVEVAALKAGSEGRIGNDKFEAGYGAEASVLKAYAKADLKAGISKEYAGVKAEAGIGGSVVEGSLKGSVGSRWLGLTVEGEVSGSLLSAEAKGTFAAGYNREKQQVEFELGGKIGAALAGGGARVKFVLNKPGWWPFGKADEAKPGNQGSGKGTEDSTIPR